MSTIKPVKAQTATIEEVSCPSMVRAGEDFHVAVTGTYETNAPMDLPVILIQASDDSEVGRGISSVDCPEGVVSTGEWQISIELEAPSPSPDEYDADGRYRWDLLAVLHPFSNQPFTVTIIESGSDPYVDIIAMRLESPVGHEIREVYVGDAFLIVCSFEFSVPADTSISFRFRNSLGLYFGIAVLGDDGWVEVAGGDSPDPESEAIEFPLLSVGPLDPVDDWLWEFELVATTTDGRTASDEGSLSLHVLERVERWAEFRDIVVQPTASPGETFNVILSGAYVFPGSTRGDLQIEITYMDGNPILGGATQTIPDLSGRGPFSQIFALTAPEVDGDISLVAKLWISGNPEPVNSADFGLEIRAGVEDDYYCRIDSVEVNGAAPPQDVTYGDSFRLSVRLSWNLPLDSLIILTIWDWDRIVAPIVLDYMDGGGEGETRGVTLMEISADRVPPRNGPWNLRAEVQFATGAGGLDRYTPDGYERIFQVNIVGAEGIAGGVSDWAVTGVWASPVDPFLGTDVSFVSRIELSTADPLPQIVSVAYSVDGVEQPIDAVTFEDGMAFLAVSSPAWTPTLGDHTIRWEVDPDLDYDDPSRANNVMEVTFSVSETPPLPPGTEPPTEPPSEEFDFYVTAVPTEQTVASPVTYTVTVDVTSGIAEPVELELMGAPPGVSFLFDPPSGSPSYTSTLTITTASNVPAGTYQMTIKAVGGGKERYKPITLVVEKGPEYTLSVTPNSAQAKPGETVEFTVYVTSETGYSQYVNLIVSGVPNGVTWNLDPQAQTPTFQSKLTFKLGEDVRPGVYRITVAGSGADAKRSTITLRVEGTAQRFDRESEALVDYLAIGILATIVAIIASVSFLAFRRYRAKKAGVFCIECGERLPAGSDFCSKCGTKQTKTEVS